MTNLNNVRNTDYVMNIIKEDNPIDDFHLSGQSSHIHESLSWVGIINFMISINVTNFTRWWSLNRWFDEYQLNDKWWISSYVVKTCFRNIDCIQQLKIKFIWNLYNLQYHIWGSVWLVSWIKQSFLYEIPKWFESFWQILDM